MLTNSATETLIHSLVHSHIDYCNSLLAGMPHCLIQNVQKIQNFAARVVTKSNKYCHITPLLYSLHWLPVEMRIRYKILVLVFKCIHKMAPNYLQNLIISSNTTYDLRNRSAVWLNVPNISCITLGGRAFCRLGPLWWNDLPLQIRKINCLHVFLKSIKTHLFMVYFSN